MPIYQPITGGTGSGSGSTATTDTVATFAAGETHTVTHPAVALDSGAIRFSALSTVAGASYTSVAPTWTPEDLNENGATWVQDSEANGHFSKAPGTRVKTGCLIYLEALNIIESMTGDGTAPSSVTLLFAVASGNISRILALDDYFGAIKSARSEGTGQVPGVYSYATSSQLTIQGTGQPFTAAKVQLITGLEADSSNVTNPRAAISADGGVTWRAYQPLGGWTAIDLDQLATDGCVIADGVWKDSNGDPLDAEALDELAVLLAAEGAGMDIRLAVGFQGVTGDGNVSAVTLSSKDPDFVGVVKLAPAAESGGGGSSALGVLRLSSTTARFSMPAYGASLTNALLSVWT